MTGNGEYPELLCKSVDRSNLRFCFKTRERRTNKGDFGRVLCICGSYNESGLSMAGAAILSAAAALRVGSGLVKVFTHRENFAPISANLPEAVMLLYGDEINEDMLSAEIKVADAILVGCGLCTGDVAESILRVVLRYAACPLVIDADGLNLLVKNPQLWDLLGTEQRARTVITPHMGEMARLTGMQISDILNDPVKVAMDYSRSVGVITLLKDHKTVITNGRSVYLNQSGNSGMSTAGSGDVLSGILVGMLGNSTLYSKNLTQKVAIGAYLHGLAGDEAKNTYGENSLIASDISNAVCKVILGVDGECLRSEITDI